MLPRARQNDTAGQDTALRPSAVALCSSGMTVQVEVAALAVSGISTTVPMTAAIRASLLSGLIDVLVQTAGMALRGGALHDPPGGGD